MSSRGFGKVKPTKPELDGLKNKRKLANRGKHLLELKREQLLTRIKQNMKKYIKLRKDARTKMLDAYSRLNHTYMKYGKRRIKLLAEINKIHYKTQVQIKHFNYMGIDIPKIELIIEEKEKYPSYSFQDTPIEFDDHLIFAKDVLNTYIKLAELDSVMFHFAFSYQKIQRRITGLEDIFIPRLEHDIKMIEDILEDLEREESIRMKEIKKNLESKEIKLLNRNENA